MIKRKTRVIIGSMALMVFMSHTVYAETVTTQTFVTGKPLPNVEQIDFSSFDLNSDGILSMPEVGERLFYAFDMDGNEIIDNIEFDKKSFATIIPMEKRTYTFVDQDNNGTIDAKTYNYETFIQQSNLMRFDRNMDGLSPAEFIGHAFLEMDDNNDGAIDLAEWKESYIQMVIPPVAEQEHYN
jgi:hypothetical protein